MTNILDQYRVKIDVNEDIQLVPLRQTKHLSEAVKLIKRNKQNLIKTRTHIADTDTFKKLKAFMDEKLEDRVTFGILYKGKLVGMTAIHSYSIYNQSAYTLLWIDRYYKRKGIGQSVTQATTKFSFEVMKLNILYKNVLANNTISQNNVKKAGFQVGYATERYVEFYMKKEQYEKEH